MDRMNEEGLGITIRHQLDENVAMWNRYAWQCIRCGMAYHRQRRTIVPSRHLCSRCRGALVEVTLEPSMIARPDTLTEPNLEKQFNEPLQPRQLCFDF